MLPNERASIQVFLNISNVVQCSLERCKATINILLEGPKAHWPLCWSRTTLKVEVAPSIEEAQCARIKQLLLLPTIDLLAQKNVSVNLEAPFYRHKFASRNLRQAQSYVASNFRCQFHLSFQVKLQTNLSRLLVLPSIFNNTSSCRSFLHRAVCGFS